MLETRSFLFIFNGKFVNYIVKIEGDTSVFNESLTTESQEYLNNIVLMKNMKTISALI